MSTYYTYYCESHNCQFFSSEALEQHKYALGCGEEYDIADAFDNLEVADREGQQYYDYGQEYYEEGEEYYDDGEEYYREGEEFFEDDKDIPPPVPTPGKWVCREDFEGQKSFGYFECYYCNKWWISAHSYKKYRQACNHCETYTFAKKMWVNEPKEKPDPSKIEIQKREGEEGHHDCGRCEACKAGDCTGLSKNFRDSKYDDYDSI